MSDLANLKSPDLIDLKTPETTIIESSKLPSPLIPVSKNVENILVNELSTTDASTTSVQDELKSRKSIDNNPFDMVIRQISEYVNKAEDPFESVWEKATSSSSSSIDNNKSNINSIMHKDGKKIHGRIPSIYIEPSSPNHDLSILNQSAMNDTLSTSSDSDPKIASFDSQQISMCIQQGTIDTELMNYDKPINDNNFNKFRRSFSQGDCLPIKKTSRSKSQTIAGDKLNDLQSDKDLMSWMAFSDPMNQAFLPKTNKNSTSNTSDVSTISRLTSQGSSNLSSCSYNSTANRAFIDSNTGNVEVPDTIGSNLSDLILKFNHLKANLTNRSSESEYFELDNIGKKKNQLVDLSNDSVFIENNVKSKDDIFIHAQNLEKKFEQLATGSCGNINISYETPPDQMSNEDIIEPDIPVDNLIDFSPSPVKSFNSKPTNNQDNTESNKNDDDKLNQQNDNDSINSLDTKLVDPDKKLEEAILLMNLKKLIKSENNLEAIELLKNLENVLGVTCQSNSELLKFCLQEKTNLSKSINKSKIDEFENNTDNEKQSNISIHIDDYEYSNENSKQLSSEDNTNIDESKSIHDEINKSQETNIVKSMGNKNLVVDIKNALEKLIINVNGEPEKLLENINKILDKDDEKNSSLTPKKSGLSYRSIRSLSHQSMNDSNGKIKKTIERTPIKRRSLVVNQSIYTPKKNESKTRIDSPKKSPMKRISSDPGISKVFVEKKVPDTVLKMQKTMPIMDKTKLRKKYNKDMPLLGKKGPLKALIPMGSMQRETLSVTPSKIGRKIPSALKLVTSTPQQNSSILIDCIKKSPKKKPVASSTPDRISKIWKAKIQIPDSPKNKNNMSWNISPVSPTPPVQLPNKSMSETKKRQSEITNVSRSRVSTTPRQLNRSSISAMIKSPRQLNSPLKKLNKSCSMSSAPRQSICKVGDTNKNITASPLKEKNSSSLKFQNSTKIRKYSFNGDLTKENKLKYN
ncbi:hypothetical protein HCN44_000609 [Aphidius gifuensis]|uniref:Uncharacterized protein n=1 Tax=Aphidius gifuensis TaxID=684658 RepID=A0A834XT60_APHGI|nr:uncharacterized protein PF11_0213-like isoform X2 [Aphidius gifuensis]KAF7990804.1 hypothetical protein HCN44_000609 [Aphidius gifuensis]